MVLPNRSYSSALYRYGFNGMEKDEEFTGSQSHYDFGARIYDGRIGRWLAVDPLLKNYLYASPYNYTLNNPVKLTDFDGRYVRGDKTTSLSTFMKVLRAWEVEAVKHAEVRQDMVGMGEMITTYENENHAKIRVFDHDFRGKQLVNEVAGKGGFSYNRSFGKYLNVGLPLDVAHFFKMANLAQDYPDPIVRIAYINEEYNQAEDPRDGGRTSAFAPEDLFSNELGVIFGDGLDSDADFSAEFEVFMNEVKQLFTNNELSSGKYLTEGKIEDLREIASEYYGTRDLSTFNKSNDIYKLDNIKTINNNAFHDNKPFYNNDNNSDPPTKEELGIEEKSN